MNLGDLIREVQGAVGVKVDGNPGPKTWTAIHEKLVPVTTSTVTTAAAAPVVSAEVKSDLIFNHWPREADAKSLFGYPPNLTQIEVVYPMQMDGTQITRISCNLKVAPSLRRIFAAILRHYQGDLAALRADGLDAYDGCFADRTVRGSSKRSMHAYGAAIDLDAAHNPLGATHGRMPRAVVEIFKAEGWRWGGDYTGRQDWMHFEACS